MEKLQKLGLPALVGGLILFIFVAKTFVNIGYGEAGVLFKTFGNGWTYHDALGWVFISDEQKDGLWMWRETNGWLWTDSQTWPFLWQHDLANWLYLFPSRSGEPPIFYDYGYSKYRE